MYKVLIADDEEIIIESISKLIDWGKYGLLLAGTARNGLEAYEMIIRDRPHIVITDIKMPGMNGLDLMEKVKKDYPDIIFIILSGYGEFDYASKAIKYGVRHYLLKPCDESEIVPVLLKIKEELKQKEKKEQLLVNLEHSLRKVLPQVKEQFLRDFALSSLYSAKDCEFFKRLFGITENRFKMILLKIETDCDFIERFALKNISEEIIGSEKISLSAIVGENILLLIPPIGLNDLNTKFEDIRSNFSSYYGMDLSMAVSAEEAFENIPAMYGEVQECLKYVFYLEEGAIVTKEDISLSGNLKNDRILQNSDKIADLVKTGNVECLEREMILFFEGLKTAKYDINLVRSYCMELFLTISRQCGSDTMGEYIGRIHKVQEMNTLKQISEFISSAALEIARFNYDNTVRNYSIIIDKVIRSINDNIQNPDLSLTWIAREILYMNENYLGRLFSREMKEKFSQYVMRTRMEKAKELLESSNDYKIYEVSQMTGFSDYSQYFSQVFKKYTGCTPTEYKNR